MSLQGNSNDEKIWNYLKSKGLNDFGIAGLMGNLRAESGLNPKNLQNSYETKLGFNDAEYTSKVDDGSYTNFIKDKAGYGLAQWTWWTRKQNLINYAKSQKKSIGDLEMQLNFLWKELSEGYKSVLNTLKSATSVLQASNAVLLQFEKPANQSKAVQDKRAQYGQEYYEKFSNKGGNSMSYSRQKVVDLAESWVGKNEKDGTYKSIIDIYNTQKTFPRGTKMQYGWAWCACTWSALAIRLGYTPVMPVEISCYYLIEAAKKMGCWQENDTYVPSPGDAILYDWEDNGVGDNKGNPDHVGTVTYVNKASGYMIVTEGNYSNSVKKRTISLNGRYIRGFITPKYTDNSVSAPVQKPDKDITTIAREVIAGQWGTGAERKKALESKGYNYAKVQKKVNEIVNGSAVKPSTPTQPQTQPTSKKVTATCSAKKYDKSIAGTYVTTADLYMRNDAGTNMKALVVIPKNTEVKCYGYYNVSNGAKWYYIQVTIDGVQYTGFSHSGYLKRK